MPSSGPRSELRSLRRFIAEVDQRYLAPHIATTSLGAIGRDEELDVAAFAVLTHGAFENFLEGLSVWALHRIEENWVARRRASRSTSALLLEARVEIDHEKETRSVFDILRESLKNAKALHSKIIEKNHGIATKHLHSLLAPLGIDVPTDPILIGSLNTLVKMRHQWAHQYRFGAKSSKSAADARMTVGDCLSLAERLCSNVVALKL